MLKASPQSNHRKRQRPHPKPNPQTSSRIQFPSAPPPTPPQEMSTTTATPTRTNRELNVLPFAPRTRTGEGWELAILTRQTLPHPAWQAPTDPTEKLCPVHRSFIAMSGISAHHPISEIPDAGPTSSGSWLPHFNRESVPRSSQPHRDERDFGVAPSLEFPCESTFVQITNPNPPHTSSGTIVDHAQ